MTAVPQRTALSHAFGGLAAGMVGTAKYYLWAGEGGQEGEGDQTMYQQAEHPGDPLEG